MQNLLEILLGQEIKLKKSAKLTLMQLVLKTYGKTERLCLKVLELISTLNLNWSNLKYKLQVN